MAAGDAPLAPANGNTPNGVSAAGTENGNAADGTLAEAAANRNALTAAANGRAVGAPADNGAHGLASSRSAPTSTGPPPAAAHSAGGAQSQLQLLRAFLRTQERRARLYAQLHDGFRAFLATRNEAAYQRLLAALTSGFSECSREVLGLEAALAVGGSSISGSGEGAAHAGGAGGGGQARAGVAGGADGRAARLCALLRRVQEAERPKLRLTLSLQALRGAHAAERFSWQHEGQHGGGCAGCCAADGLGGGGGGGGEPSEAEYGAAVREAVQQLDSVVLGINDALEEVRYEVEELLEAGEEGGEEAMEA